MRPFVTLSLLLALAPTAPLAAQFVQPLPQTTPPGDADALADQVRVLAVNPSDLNALVRAGELALKLEDPTAAGSFFARAERIDPRNGRVKAGLGELLVQAERPGEALRRFAEAESYGARPSTFAADRGLAYDLIGEQERAQRDYRLALKTGPDDETTRRYALSLGISGKREEALALLDPLLRKSDRGAWRARAFILAMSGNRVDAEQIATTMMPAGMSQGLQPFFDRLPSLSPVDRAFAVHFGETRPSTQRLADARMVPALPPLGVDPDARERAVAAQARDKPVRKVEAKVEQPASRKRGRREPVELAFQAAAPPVALSLPAPPSYVDPATAAPDAQRYYVQRLPGARTLPPSYGPVAQANRAAAAATMPVLPAASVPAGVPVAEVRTQIAPAYPSVQRTGGRVMPLAPLQPQPLPSTAVAPTRYAPPAQTVTKVEAAAPVAAAVVAIPPAEIATRVERVPQSLAVASVMPRAPVAIPTPVDRVPQAVAVTPTTLSAALAARSASAIPPLPLATAPARSVASAPPGAAPAAASNFANKAQNEDAILAGIIARIGVPGAELGVTPAEPAGRPAPEPVRVAPVQRAATAPLQVEQQHHRPAADPAPKPVAKKASETAGLSAKANTRSEVAVDSKKATGARNPADKKSADVNKPGDGDAGVAPRKADAKKTFDKKKAKKSVDEDAGPDPEHSTDAKKKSVTAKKAVDAEADADRDTKKPGKLADKKADAKKAAEAKKKDPRLLEPSRVWVQVSGGANENDLPKQWSKLRADQPAMFKNRQGYATPLRATNRILTGPFASETEAQAYVNKLAKQGLSGFLFTSDAGQKVSKLPTK